MIACACFSGKFEGGDQRFARVLRVLGGANEADHLIEVIERFWKPSKMLLALARPAQLVLGATAYDLDAVLDEVLEAIHQAELARLAVDNGEHDHAEADLKLRVLIEIVEDDVGLLAALELVDDAHAVAIALVANFADALELLLVD